MFNSMRPLKPLRAEDLTKALEGHRKSVQEVWKNFFLDQDVKSLRAQGFELTDELESEFLDPEFREVLERLKTVTDSELSKLKTKDAYWLNRLRELHSQRIHESKPNRFSYGEMSDLFRMILSESIFQEVFEPMFEEIKENHIRLRARYEQRPRMRVLLDIEFVFRGIGLIGQCWKAAGLDKFMVKLAALWGLIRSI